MAKLQIKIPGMITVGDLAKELDISTVELISELIKSGIMATVNEKIDAETAQIILDDLEKDVEIVAVDKEASKPEKKERKLTKKAQIRPPVVAVMGHVDHGKTSLLDAMRGSKITEDEAGGITQHITAYQVEHKKRLITFLDTPGHEAFSALRQHGAKLTDLAIIVVAADDGVKPQTKEAIKFAKSAGVKILVAINKIDKEGANINRVMQELSDNGLNPEAWGGDVVTMEVSAVKNKGIDELQDMILLIADVEDLKADVDCPAEGLVIEVHMATGKGSVASLLIEHGVLKKGDSIYAGSAYGKVRTLTDEGGNPITKAGPSTPVIVTGFKQLPDFGDTFHVVASEKLARAEAGTSVKASDGSRLNMSGSDLLKKISLLKKSTELEVILRTDVKGSLKSIADSLRALENDEVSVRVVGSGVGSISESDVTMASTSGAVIYGFSIDLPVAVKQLAIKENVEIKIFDVIYELIDDAKLRLEGMLEPEIVETEVGKLIVKGVFRTIKTEIICGGEVTKGKVVPDVIAKMYRDGEELAEAKVISVKRQQQDVKEVFKGDMCGLQLETVSKTLLQEGDKLEFITRETKARKL